LIELTAQLDEQKKINEEKDQKIQMLEAQLEQ